MVVHHWLLWLNVNCSLCTCVPADANAVNRTLDTSTANVVWVPSIVARLVPVAGATNTPNSGRQCHQCTCVCSRATTSGVGVQFCTIWALAEACVSHNLAHKHKPQENSGCAACASSVVQLHARVMSQDASSAAVATTMDVGAAASSAATGALGAGTHTPTSNNTNTNTNNTTSGTGSAAPGADDAGAGGVTQAVALAQQLVAAQAASEEAKVVARTLLAEEMALPDTDVPAKRAARKRRKKAKKTANKLMAEVRRLEKLVRLAGFSNEAEKAAAEVRAAAVPERPARLRLRLKRPGAQQLARAAASGRVRSRGPTSTDAIGFERRLRYHGRPIPARTAGAEGEGEEVAEKGSQAAAAAEGGAASGCAVGGDAESIPDVLPVPEDEEPFEVRAFPLR